MQASMPSGSPGWMPLLLKKTGRPSALARTGSNTPSGENTPRWIGTPPSEQPASVNCSHCGNAAARRRWKSMASRQVVVWLPLPRSNGVAQSWWVVSMRHCDGAGAAGNSGEGVEQAAEHVALALQHRDVGHEAVARVERVDQVLL